MIEQEQSKAQHSRAKAIGNERAIVLQEQRAKKYPTVLVGYLNAIAKYHEVDLSN